MNTVFLLPAGAAAGVTQAVFAAPMDTVNMQMWEKRGSGARLSLFSEFRTAVRTKGFRILYQHFPLTLFRDCVGLGLFFTTFEVGKRLTVSDHPRFFLQNGLAVLFSGALAGLAHQAVFHPVDILKRSLILDLTQRGVPSPPFSQMWPLFKELVIRKRGFRYLFRGYLLSMTKAMPPAALAFLVYEATSNPKEVFPSDKVGG